MRNLAAMTVLTASFAPPAPTREPRLRFRNQEARELTSYEREWQWRNREERRANRRAVRIPGRPDLFAPKALTRRQMERRDRRRNLRRGR